MSSHLNTTPKPDKNENFTSFGDYIHHYLNESTVQCFEKCVGDFSSSSFKSDERNCMEGCFEKYFVSYSNIATLMDLSRK